MTEQQVSGGGRMAEPDAVGKVHLEYQAKMVRRQYRQDAAIGAIGYAGAASLVLVVAFLLVSLVRVVLSSVWGI